MTGPARSIYPGAMSGSAASPTRERELLEAIRGGDERAFRELVEPYRSQLQAHCYRMLGSVQDAEDATQEALVRAWRGLPRFEGRSSLRAWLYRIATNTCLDAIAKRPKRVLPIDYGPPADPHDGPGKPLVESVWVEPYPDEVLAVEDGYAEPEARYEQRESVELAFIAALQHLPATQRAALILREVLGFSAREVAETLDTSVPAVNSSLQRARRGIEEKLPERSQQSTLRSIGDEEIREMVATYVDAWERGDADAIAAMLAEDATITMPPMPTWFRGREAVLAFLTDWAFAKRWAPGRSRFESGQRRVRAIPARASGQLAFGTYSWRDEEEAYRPQALQVLTLDGARIAEIAGFVMPDALPRFGLPERLEALGTERTDT
jgi:RNA polymerase sigma-70 factor (ECF subfamily)